MKVKFITEDQDEIMRLSKSLDMALFIFDITHNTRKGLLNELEGQQYEEFDKYDAVELVFDRIYEKLNERNINIDEILT